MKQTIAVTTLGISCQKTTKCNNQQSVTAAGQDLTYWHCHIQITSTVKTHCLNSTCLPSAYCSLASHNGSLPQKCHTAAFHVCVSLLLLSL